MNLEFTVDIGVNPDVIVQAGNKVLKAIYEQNHPKYSGTMRKSFGVNCDG